MPVQQSSPRPSVLIAAGRSGWEPEALRTLTDARIVVLKRCVDMPDLLASASSGQADVAVVAADLVGLDLDAVQRLRAHDVLALAVLDPSGPVDPDVEDRVGGLGLPTLADLASLPDSIEALLAAPTVRPVVSAPVGEEDLPAAPHGRVVAVWGPTGAPGRTTVAVGLAAERAASGAPVVLLDADPYGGSIGQHLGVLDEVSGLLACARFANEGALDRDTFRTCRRRVADGLEVLTGLPRADRWIEVRGGVVEAALDLAAADGDVVADCGFSLEDTGHGRLARNTTTLEVLGRADEVVLVGSAEPTGLSRLARALVELAETAAIPTRVVVNRMRDTLGWRRRDIVGMVEGYAPDVPVHFLPEDRMSLDRALVAGKALTELGECALRSELRSLCAEVFQ